MSKFKIKISIPYVILLSETGENPIEAIAMVCIIRHLKRIEKMGVGRWPNVIFNQGMSERKKTWMKKNYTWMKNEIFTSIHVPQLGRS